jgi:hypothetical protein
MHLNGNGRTETAGMAGCFLIALCAAAIGLMQNHDQTFNRAFGMALLPARSRLVSAAPITGDITTVTSIASSARGPPIRAGPNCDIPIQAAVLAIAPVLIMSEMRFTRSPEPLGFDPARPRNIRQARRNSPLTRTQRWRCVIEHDG